jgi:predicted nucleic acid-binding protein
MIALDLSVLAFAVNRYAPEHARANRVVEDLVNGERPWALPWSVVHEFLQLVTHPHAVVRPLKAAEAHAFVERLLESPAANPLAHTPAHAQAFGEVLASLEPSGGLPAGFETAVLLREHGVREILSSDRGMRRFHFLTVVDPLHGAGWLPAAGPTRRYRVLRTRSPR